MHHIEIPNRGNRFPRGNNSLAESVPPEESMPRNRLPVANNFLKYLLERGIADRHIENKELLQQVDLKKCGKSFYSK
jgi:hypothetical protein